MRHRQDGHRALAEAQVGHAGVLDLAVRVADVRREAVDLGHLSEQVQQHLDAVAAEVGHRPAARLAPSHQPGARVIGPRVEGLEGLRPGPGTGAPICSRRQEARRRRATTG